MNIVEAIKSNKKYRRKGEKGWYDTVKDFSHYVFSVRDVLADDWETEAEPVTITREQFDAAINTVSDKNHRPFERALPLHDFLVELKKELGL